MTLNQATRITGLYLVASNIDGIHRVFAWPNQIALNDEPLFIAASDSSIEECLEEILDRNLAHVRNVLARAQKYRCGDCGQRKPLQHHHIKHKSQGRDDRPENGVMLCQGCHNRRHGK